MDDNIAIYTRVSTGEQAENGTGLERQSEVCNDFVRSKGWDGTPGFFKVYADAGVSGSVAGIARPGFALLLEQLGTFGGARRIVVERADRLARDLIESEVIIRGCKELGIEIWCADSGEEIVFSGDSDPTRKLIRQLVGAIAEWDKNVTVKKMQDGRRRKIAETGRCGGREPYNDTKVIRHIVELRKRGFNLSAIAHDLNANDDLPSPTGALWSRRTIKRILDREGEKE